MSKFIKLTKADGVGVVHINAEYIVGVDSCETGSIISTPQGEKINCAETEAAVMQMVSEALSASKTREHAHWLLSCEHDFDTLGNLLVHVSARCSQCGSPHRPERVYTATITKPSAPDGSPDIPQDAWCDNPGAYYEDAMNAARKSDMMDYCGSCGSVMMNH